MIITVNITNKELIAFEKLLIVKEPTEKNRNLSLQLWKKLIEEFDREKSKKDFKKFLTKG